MSKFYLEIVSPSATLFQGEVESLTVPLHDGFMQVLANHSTGVGMLKEGTITIFDGIENKKLNCKGGVLNIQDDKTTILGSNFSWI